MKKLRKMLACLSALIMSLTVFTGCSTNAMYDKVMFEYAGKQVPLKTVWALALYDIEEMSLYYGNTMWDEKYSEDAEGNDVTFKEAILQNTVYNIAEVCQFLSVQDKYDCELTADEKEEIKTVVEDYRKNFSDLLEETPITDEDLTQIFSDNYKASKIYEAVSKEYAETLETSDYSRNVYYDYCIASTTYDISGKEIDLSIEKYKECENQMKKIYKKLESGKKIDDIVENSETSESQEISIGKDNESNYDKELLKQAVKLKKVGDYSPIFKTDGYWHILVLTSKNDKEASEDALTTATNEKIIDEFLTNIEKEHGEFNYEKDVDKDCIDFVLEIFKTEDYLDKSALNTSNDDSDEEQGTDEVSTEAVSEQTNSSEVK